LATFPNIYRNFGGILEEFWRNFGGILKYYEEI